MPRCNFGVCVQAEYQDTSLSNDWYTLPDVRKHYEKINQGYRFERDPEYQGDED